MSRALIVINGPVDRRKVVDLVGRVPPGTRCEFKGAKRSLPQNDRMWAMLTDIAGQIGWHGQRLRPDEWKLLFLDALNREVKAVPALDGKGFVNIGSSSSDLSKDEMTNLIELMFAWGAEHGVTFNEPGDGAHRPKPERADGQPVASSPEPHGRAA